MEKKLRRGLKVKFLLFGVALLLGFTVKGAYSQSLSAGDVAFTGLNVDGKEDFAVVVFKSFAGGDKIHFSNQEWNGSSFAGSGGDLTWVAPSGGITAGTVLEFNNVDDNPTVNIGSIGTGDSNFGLSSAGDVIYAYTGSTQDNPDVFLGAVATAVDRYDGSEGTLTNTGLVQDSTAILLSDNVDNAEYIGDRSGNTISGYHDLLNNINSETATDDNWEQVNGDNTAPFPPFDTQSFALVSSPTIAFSSGSPSTSENGTSIDLTIELAESNGTAVNVDVAFLPGTSTATASDIDNYQTTNVSFGSGAGSGDTKTVKITLTNDTNFEGGEKAVFQLQNISSGTIINPGVVTLSISDDDNPNVVINEFLASPPSGSSGDANGNGVRDGSDEEFVELVNNSSREIDISGWQISDNGSDIQYTFPAGTVLPANRAVVVFGGSGSDYPSGNFGGAIVQSSDDLSLNDAGDIVTLFDEKGNVIQEVAYGDAGAVGTGDESFTRNSDITGSFEAHSAADSDNDGSLFSPGTKVDGSPFGSKHAIAFRGTEGWRMVASPVQNATFDDFFGELWMQGVTGSDDPSGQGTLFSWAEGGGGSYTQPGNMSDPIEPGSGYFVYVFEDDQYTTPGIQGGFPKIISSNGIENSTVDNISVSATDESGDGTIDNDEGWNLLGNPFGTDIKASAVIDVLEGVNPNINTQILVWDHDANAGNGTWVSVDGADASNATIAPFQAFFVRFGETATGVNGTVSFDKSSLQANQGTAFYKNRVEESIVFNLNLHGEQYYDTYTLEFSDKGSTELDRYDAYKLFSLNSNSVNLFSTINKNRLQKNVLPRELDANLEIPLSFDASGRTSLTFKWNSEMKNIPSEWELMLIDREQNREIDLRRSNEYKFTVNSTRQQQKRSASTSDRKGLLNKVTTIHDSRFVLSVKPKKQAGGTNELPESVKLNPNYPNPFNPQTTIPYELTQDSEVKLTVWNMIGQKVATLVDGLVEAGTHEETWNATNMPSGIYIARFEVNGNVFTRKMTLIK